MNLEKTIYQRGEIVITSRLDQGYYDYTTGTEVLALNRISGALFDVINISTGQQFSDVVATLRPVVSIGSEVYAAKIPQWLALEVFGINRVYEDIDKFKGCMQLIARETFKRVGSHSTKFAAAIIIGDMYIVITDDD